MKCTDKEWQHCRAEKMGCKGCYYDYVSKEEIRNIIKKLDTDIKRNERRKIEQVDENTYSFTQIAYSPETIKKVLESLL